MLVWRAQSCAKNAKKQHFYIKIYNSGPNLTTSTSLTFFTAIFLAFSGALAEELKGKGMVYIALYPVRWTAQSTLHFPPLADLFIPTPFSASLGSILAMQQLRNDYSLTFPPLSIARYSFMQLRRREVKENAQTSKL